MNRFNLLIIVFVLVSINVTGIENNHGFFYDYKACAEAGKQLNYEGLKSFKCLQSSGAF